MYITELLLRFKSSQTGHDARLLEGHIRQRATEIVDDDLSLILAKLDMMQGYSSSHRHAMSKISNSYARSVM
jgi:hypothetical protein